MKKYLLLIEDEKLWEKFKNVINKDINIRQPGAWSQFLNYEGTNVWIDLRLNETTKVLDIYTWFLASRNNTWYGIIEYTKTTD